MRKTRLATTACGWGSSSDVECVGPRCGNATKSEVSAVHPFMVKCSGRLPSAFWALLIFGAVCVVLLPAAATAQKKPSSPLVEAALEKISELEALVAQKASALRLATMVEGLSRSLEGRKLQSDLPRAHCYMEKNGVLMEVLWTLQASNLAELARAFETTLKPTGCAEMDAILSHVSVAFGKLAKTQFRVDIESSAYAAACRLGNKAVCKHQLETSANLLRLSTLLKHPKYSNSKIDESSYARAERDGWLVVKVNPDWIEIDNKQVVPIETKGVPLDDRTVAEFGAALAAAFAQEDADAKEMSRIALHNTLVLADERVGYLNMLPLLKLLDTKSGKASVAVLWDEKKGRSLPIKLLRLDFVISSFGPPVLEKDD